MVTLYAWKPMFGERLRPLCARLARAGITPNHVTLATLAVSIAAGACIALLPGALWPLLVLPGVLLLRMALNTVDGELARGHGMESRLGVILSELCDVLSEAALFLPLALVPGVTGWLVVAAVGTALLVEMAGAVAVHVGSPRRFDGPLAKPDRAVALGGAALAMGLGLTPGSWLDGLLVAVVLLGLATAANRSLLALRSAAA